VDKSKISLKSIIAPIALAYSFCQVKAVW